MRKFIFLNVLILFCYNYLFASIGGSGTGGGKGVVCNQANGQTTVELLDIWEERNLRYNQIIKSSGNLENDLNSAILRTQNVFSRQDIQKPDGSYYKENEETIKELQFTAPGIIGITHFQNVQRLIGQKLPLTDDSFEGNLDYGLNCHIEQLVVFTHGPGKTPRWQIDMDLVSKLDSMNMVALGLHEALYGFFETYGGETNSIRVRRVVGHVMAGKSFSSIQSLLATPYIKCSTNSVADELGIPKDDLRYEYFAQLFSGFIYFVNNPEEKNSRVSMIVDKIRSSRLIDFNRSNLVTQGVDLNLKIRSFYEKFANTNFSIIGKGNENDIETSTEIIFEMKSGVGRLSNPKNTGGGYPMAPLEKLTCYLIE